jgi:thioredoxin-dependent peroxiredoxin
MRHVFSIGIGFLATTLSLALVGAASAAELKPGDKAPEFSLKASDGQTYKLTDFKDKKIVVLAWFPKAFTPGCTLECKSFGAKDSPLKTLDVAYFTASVDTPETNQKFAESLGVEFPILGDPDSKVARAYGVVDDQQKFARRWTFYIGTDGRILEIDKKVNCPSHAADVAKKLQELGAKAKP